MYTIYQFAPLPIRLVMKLFSLLLLPFVFVALLLFSASGLLLALLIGMLQFFAAGAILITVAMWASGTATSNMDYAFGIGGAVLFMVLSVAVLFGKNVIELALQRCMKSLTGTLTGSLHH